MKKTYENAIRILETRRRKARPKNGPGRLAVSGMPGLSGDPTFRGTPSLVGMGDWLQRLGHSSSDINELNFIHVAGTKGKGSTCAFIRSFLRVHGVRTGFPQKVGLYTSPDLRCIRERIQINDEPILKADFAKYFFEVWDGLSSPKPESTERDGAERLPRYLQLLALVAFHVFIREQTQAVICETHHGGEYDATNVIQEPAVTGITSIGLDHVAQLGPTLENIAWHKAGIFKRGAPAFSTPQDSRSAAVLQARAEEKNVKLKFVPTSATLPTDSQSLKVQVQRMNCSLAIALTDAFLERKAPQNHGQLTQDDISEGIKKFSWPGRFETIQEGKCEWYLDGAHNNLSVKQAALWFAQNTARRRTIMFSSHILIFSHYSEERDGANLLECLAKSLLDHGIQPHTVIFTTYEERLDGTTRIGSPLIRLSTYDIIDQDHLDKTFKTPETPFPDFLTIYAEIWRKLDPEAEVFTEVTIEGALNVARKIGEQSGGMQTLVTGSLHLVGGALNILRPFD